MLLEVHVDIDAPRRLVWDVLVDWERQPRWMVDARSVEVTSQHRAGEGVRLEVPTRLLGVTVLDVMQVTSWRAPERLEVAHLGKVIRGSGAFVLADRTSGGTRLIWEESIDLPLGSLGEFAAGALARPIVTRTFRRSLARLKRECEREAAGT